MYIYTVYTYISMYYIYIYSMFDFIPSFLKANCSHKPWLKCTKTRPNKKTSAYLNFPPMAPRPRRSWRCSRVRWGKFIRYSQGTFLQKLLLFLQCPDMAMETSHLIRTPGKNNENCWTIIQPALYQEVSPSRNEPCELSNEKNSGCLGYIGDYTTSSIGIIMNQYKDPLLNNQQTWKVIRILSWLNSLFYPFSGGFSSNRTGGPEIKTLGITP